jgi:pyocin large subunit-like protein
MGIGSNRAVWTALVGSAALAVTLAACDGGSATRPAREQASASSAGADASRLAKNDYGQSGYSSQRYGRDNGYGSDDADQTDHRKDPVVLWRGKPRWASSRKYAADESAQYHFQQDGADFGAKSVDDYVAKAHAFVDKPPKDVLIMTRSNGDKVMYDAHGNVFAVVTKDGAPRTMFKPHDGQAYWDKQKAREDEYAKRGSDSSYRRRGSSRDDDNSDG